MPQMPAGKPGGRNRIRNIYSSHLDDSLADGYGVYTGLQIGTYFSIESY